MREEIAHLQTSPAPFLSTTGFKRKPSKPEKSSKKFARNSADDDVTKVKKNKSKNIVTDT